MAKKNVIIIGAAGRDFHNFNTCFRDNDYFNVVHLLQLRYLILTEENIRKSWPENYILKESRFLQKGICPI